jgi:hypothetical protein
MHLHPPDDALRKLSNQVLEIVCFAQYTMALHFDRSCHLQILAPFRHASASQLSDAPSSGFPLSNSSLMRCVGSAVRKAVCDADGALSIDFTNGDALIVDVNESPYETYTLTIDNKEYTV